MEKAVLLIKEYEHMFTGPDDQVEFTDVMKCSINTGYNKLSKCKVQRMSPIEKENTGIKVEQMLANGQVRPSKSPWVAHWALIRNKDGSLHFFFDFQLLHETTKKEAYPLPHIDEYLDSLTHKYQIWH